ncbi:MAG TPA: HD domain-containing phosphohydrolase [Acidobacteriota bacterium]|nr:HD domain-containing phosphohydrolase [Acidobacteriota bacterium]
MQEGKDQILVVDDDANILRAVERVFHGDADIEVLTATCAGEAMEIIARNPVPVVISDYTMPGVSGIEFLEWAKSAAPESMRILLTGCADLDVAINSINRGEVYRFISKPWNRTELRQLIREALQKHKVVKCLKSKNETSLLSLIRTIELKDPSTKGHSERVAGYALQLADALGISGEERMDFKYGGLIHDCGKIGVPEAVLNKPGELTAEQRELIKQHARWSGELAAMAGLNTRVVNIALYHHERFNGNGYPTGLAGSRIPREARIVALADVYDALASDRPYRKGLSHREIAEYFLNEKGTSFDPQLTDVFIGELERTRGK